MTDFIHTHMNTISVVLMLLILPFYLQKIQQWTKNCRRKNRQRRKRLR